MFRALLLLLMTLALMGGAFMAARDPAFWITMVKDVVVDISPALTKRMTPEQEKAWHQCMRWDGKWDQQEKRCKQ